MNSFLNNRRKDPIVFFLIFFILFGLITAIFAKPFVTGILGDQITLYSLIIILGIFLISIGLLSYRYFSLRDQLSSGTKDLNKLKEHKNTQSSWEQYVQTFIQIPGSSTSESSDKSPTSSKQYFNLVSLFGYESLRYWHTVPGMFVGLGVLGTFVGLTVGLAEISPEMFNDPTVLEKKLSVLIGGMKTAFMTSVVGMSASIFFSFFQRFVFGALEDLIKVLNEALDKRYRLTRKEDYQRFYTYTDKTDIYNPRQVLYPQDFMAKVIELLSEINKNQVTQGEKLTDLNTNIGNTISTELSDIGTKISESFNAQFVGLAKTIEHMTSSMQQIPDLLDDMHSKFQEEIEFQRANIHTTFEKIHENLTTEVTRVTEALKVQSEEIMKQLSATALQVGEQLSALTRESTERLQEVANTLIDNMSRTVEHLRETLIAMESGAERMTVLLDDTREMLERQEAAVEEITAAIDEMDTSFTTLSDLSRSMSEFSTHITSGTESIVSSSENLRQVVELFSDEYRRMSETEATFHNEIRRAIEETQTLVQDTSEQYNLVRTGLTGIFREVEGGLTRYADLSREGLNEYLNSFATQFNEAANQLERNFNSLNTLAERMQDAVGRIDGAWQGGLQELEQASTRIARASQGLPASLDQFQRIVREMTGSSSGLS